MVILVLFPSRPIVGFGRLQTVEIGFRGIRRRSLYISKLAVVVVVTRRVVDDGETSRLMLLLTTPPSAEITIVGASERCACFACLSCLPAWLACLSCSACLLCLPCLLA